MKYTILLCLIIVNNSYSCELMNENYIFEYMLDTQKYSFNYKITDKNKSIIRYYNEPKVGFFLSPHFKQNPTKGSTYSNFLNEDGFYVTKDKNIISLLNPKPIETNELIGNLNYKNLIINIQNNSLITVDTGVKDLSFKIKVILDKEIKKCLVFETKQIKYDFGSSFYLLRKKINEN